ncbi:MAG: four helix bundle protein [Proteobacteria bacterium]|nr:four helix bundle protein [Pseudomonadota bacterium]
MTMFVAYENAKDVVRHLLPIMEQLKLHSAELVDQLERAGTSLMLNLAEGSRRSGKDKRRFFVMAHGSAGEIRAVLDIAELWGWRVDQAAVAPILDRQLGLLWGLTHSRKVTKS